MDAIVYDKVGKEAEKVREALYGIYPQATITDAAIASFGDGADGMPIKKLVANIEPVQDLHGYDNPWPAGGGVNKFYSDTNKSNTLNGMTCSFDASTQTFTISGTNTSSSAYILADVIPTAEIPRNVAISRALIGAPTGIYMNLAYYDGVAWSGVDNGGVLPESVSLSNVRIQVGVYGSVTTVSTTTFKCQIQEGSAAPTSWTPYSNICPISGHTGAEVTRTGKNLLPIENYEIISNGITYTITSDGKIVANGTASGGVSSFYFYGQTGRKYHAGRYILTGCPMGGGTNTYSIRQMTNNTYVGQDAGTGRTLELSQNDTVVFYARVAQGVTVSNLVFEPMLRLASETDSTFEPCTNTAISVTFPSEAGTVYGGTLDVTTGLLTVDRVFGVIDGNTNIRTGFDTNFCSFYFAALSLPNAVSTSGIESKLISNRFKTTAYSTTNDDRIFQNNAEIFTIRISNPVSGTEESWHEYFAANNTQISYLIATPTTYQLTASEISAILTTLYGTNNIWADTGNIEKLTYRADLGKYIDSHITTAVANALNA